MVDIPAATIPAMKMDARNGFSPLCRINGTIWSAFSIFWMEAYPGAKYVYSHIMSVSCDERFTAEDMQKIVEAFEEFRK